MCTYSASSDTRCTGVAYAGCAFAYAPGAAILGAMGAYLDKAREFHRQAVTEFDEWKRVRSNDVLIRDAAEKAWGAVTQAANELIIVFDGGRELPVSSRGRQSALMEMERERRQLRSLHLAERYNAAQIVLHSQAFYEGDYRPADLERYITDLVKEYLDDVEQAVTRPPHR